MTHPILKVVTSDGCQSYLVGCPTTRACILVDPKVGREPTYLELMGQYGLKLSAVFDTHTHADHLSASTRLTGGDVPLWMSHATPVDRPMRKLQGGEEVEVGELRFRVIEVPGHTGDSLALFGHGLVLTGDSLLIGGLARADFVGSDPELLFKSVTERLMTLPGETLVFPGHGYNGILFSTIEAESRLNDALQFESAAAYAESLGAVIGAGNSDAVVRNLELNLAESPELPAVAGNAAACCAAPSKSAAVKIPEVAASEGLGIRDGLDDAGQWVDVRDPFEYAHGHIEGTTNIPLSELGFHLGHFRHDRHYYLSCRSGVRSMTAAKTLARLGVAARPVNVGGGILGWQGQGFPIAGEAAV